MKYFILPAFFITSLIAQQEMLTVSEAASSHLSSHKPIVSLHASVTEAPQEIDLTAVTPLVEEARKECHYGETPLNNFLADIGKELKIDSFNAILADKHNAQYATTLKALAVWLKENGY